MGLSPARCPHGVIEVLHRKAYFWQKEVDMMNYLKFEEMNFRK